MYSFLQYGRTQAEIKTFTTFLWILIPYRTIKCSWVLFFRSTLYISSEEKPLDMRRSRPNRGTEATLPSNHHPWTYRLYTLSIKFIEPPDSINVIKYNGNFLETSILFWQADPLSSTHPSLRETPSWNRVIGFALCLYLCIWCRGMKKKSRFFVCSYV